MKLDTKEKIINATIKLIEGRESRPEDITVRDICKAAGVGLSQINYHFQTKENLIAHCIQLMICDVVGKFPKVLSLSKGTSAVETLKRMMHNTLGFLYANENISRVSILTDHRGASRGDNTEQTVDAYLPLVEAICEENNISDDPKILTTLMVLAFQGMFLRTDIVRDELGIDLRSESGRLQVIDVYVDNAFRKEST